MMVGLGRRVRRLEDAAKPAREPVRILLTFVAPDGSESEPFTYGEGGTLRPATEAEKAAGADGEIRLIDRFGESGEGDGDGATR